MQAVLHVLRERRAVLRDLGLDVVERFGLRNTGREKFDQRGLTFRVGSKLDELAAGGGIRRAFEDRPAIDAPDVLVPDDRHRRAVCNSRDRKSTRLNSSHLGISYAVFCLKK